MKILSDRHHQGLTNSLRLLFEERLGHELYFQFGMEWFPDFWDLYTSMATARQYLEAGSQPFKQSAPISNVLNEEEGVYLIESFDGNPPNKGITLERFKKEKFDILLCSIPQHVNKFLKLKELYQPQAKMIFQVGNTWGFDTTFPIRNILASARVPHLLGFKICEYHQEFSLKEFSYTPAVDNHTVYSFINCLNLLPHFRPAWDLFIQLERLLPDWTFKSFGGSCRDGSFSSIRGVAEKMKEATFVYHWKPSGDGFGHVVHNAASIGRPMITNYSDYQDKLAAPFMNWDMSINVENRSAESLAEDIRRAYEQREEMGKRIYEKFKANVDFDAEEIKIREFLANLL